jgi:hypothetical protein
MRNTFLQLLLIFFSFDIFSQEKANLKAAADQLVQKAERIYALEKAAWLASDKYELNKLISKTNAEGYISYLKSDTTICFFYTNTDTIIIEYFFRKDQFLFESLNRSRGLTDYERRLISLRRIVLKLIEKNTLSNFRKEPETTYNIIPIITIEEIICYLIQSSNSNHQLVLGRDHILKFDKDFNLTSNAYNHKSTQIIPFDNHYNNQEIEESSHTHIMTNSFFETELASLMLYKNFLKIDKYLVVSKNYSSYWNNKKYKLTIEK